MSTPLPVSEAYARHPDHTITVAPHEGRVVVRFGGVVVAESERALALREASYPVALYLPFADCRVEHFRATDHTTHCPFKGDARYWTLLSEPGGESGERAENAAWGYDEPYAQVAQIAGHVAFYPNKVTIEA